MTIAAPGFDSALEVATAAVVASTAAATVPPVGASMGAEIYIYYRARPEHGPALVDAVCAMQQGLRSAWPGLGARLLRRPELREGHVTWMEAYALPLGADPGAVARAIEQAALSLGSWQASPRHVEHFVEGGTGIDLGAAASPGLT
jgi:hypothetical protein